MSFAELYRALMVPGPKASQLPDKEVAPTLHKLAEAKRSGQLPAGIVNAKYLVSFWGPKDRELNRVGILVSSGSPYGDIAFEEAIRLARLFPEQLVDGDKWNAAYNLRMIVEEFWHPNTLREAALETMALIEDRTAYGEFERLEEWAAGLRNGDTDYDHWRRLVLTTVLQVNFSEAKKYIWEEARKISDETEATLVWQSILAHPEASSFLAGNIPRYFMEVWKIDCALEAARRVGSSADQFREAMERKREEVRLK